ncbi:MAG TPA: hypothetical protein VL793_04915, partial [Patescibacteria group bacterium]|nr:hypothetical protein [Patescibacteria group bacterium]
MGDFLLDFKRGDERAIVKASEFLRFYEDMRVERYGYPEFTLLLSCADNPQIWSPFSPADQSLLIALCGRIALDQKQWDEASKVEGQGGLACKFISRIYAESGIAGVENLSGNFTIILFDRSAQKLFLVTDRWGLLPSFKFSGAGHLVFGSHPDAVADLVGESHNWDLTSLAEFVLTGKVSAPYTYYSKIKALPVGSTTTVSFDEHAVAGEQSRTYFQFQPRPEPLEKTEELAEQFAAAFRQSIAKRTLPILGKSAVALSGGLDSRTVLCAASDPRALLTFSCYDQENLE